MTTMPEMELGMKRPNTAGDDSSIDMQKRARHDMAKVRLLLLGRYCGALIGKGGENFKRLRETYGVKITGLSSRANERVLQIDGECEKCFLVIKELLPNCPEARYSSSNGKSMFEINLLANTDSVGLLIGKAGSKMKEITTEAGCKLKVYPKCLPQSNERVVSIGGDTEETVIDGAKLVLHILTTATPRSPTVFFSPDNNSNPDLSAMDLANAMGGGGVRGQTQKMMPLQQQTHIQTPQGNPLDTNIAMMLIAQRELKQHNPIDTRVDFGLVKTSTSITLSNEMCGAIIGKGGQNIKFTKNMSGAQIEFTKIDPASQESGMNMKGVERTITVTGTQEQVRIAEELMNQCVHGSESLLRNGGGGGGNTHD